MKRSEIKVGEEYAIVIGYAAIERPTESRVRGERKPKMAPYFQTRGGIPKANVERHLHRATVVEVGVDFYEAVGSWSSSLGVRDSNGIRVKLATPIAATSIETVSEIVVTAGHVLRTWADEKASREARSRAEREARERADREAAEFAPKLADLRSKMLTITGARTGVHDDVSGVYGEGWSISLRRAKCSDGIVRPIGFTYGSVHVDLDLFRKLVEAGAFQAEIDEVSETAVSG